MVFCDWLSFTNITFSKFIHHQPFWWLIAWARFIPCAGPGALGTNPHRDFGRAGLRSWVQVPLEHFLSLPFGACGFFSPTLLFWNWSRLDLVGNVECACSLFPLLPLAWSATWGQGGNCAKSLLICSPGTLFPGGDGERDNKASLFVFSVD